MVTLAIALAVIAVPLAVGYHPIPPVPVHFDNKDDGSAADGNLVVWAITNGSCTDKDHGIKHDGDGNSTFTDDDDGNFYAISDYCLDSKNMVSFACTDDIKIDGKNKRNDLFVAAIVDCSQYIASYGKPMSCNGGRCV